jgi:uncharacterized protein YecE (DUF72 family)
VKLLVGTSGYAFKEWKGVFYPQELSEDGWLGFYAGRYPTVEINNTFYRLPKEHVIREWAAQVPAGFTFSIKASMRITHHARLKPESASAVEFLLKNTEALESRMGPVLFQLPPNMKKETERLKVFLGALPRGRRYTMEFRHESWFEPEVLDALREHDIALCVSEAEDFTCPMASTASWGYLRLHRKDYDAEALGRWAAVARAQQWTDAYVYFKHDEGKGSGPDAADAFVRLHGDAG